MGIYKAENGTWFVSCSYEDWTGKKSRKVKRGFKTKKEANEWESNFMVKNSGNLEMNFREFTMLYVSDIRNRLRVNTWLTKKAIIEKKILPYAIIQEAERIRREIDMAVPREEAKETNEAEETKKEIDEKKLAQGQKISFD